MEQKLYIDDLEQAVDAKVVLVHDLPAKENLGRTLSTWTSYVTDDLVLSSTAEYSSPLADLASQATETANTWQAVVGMITSRFGVSDTGAVEKIVSSSVRSYAQSIMVWGNSERPTFSVPMHFVTWRKDHTGNRGVTRRATELASMPLPGISSSVGDSIMSKPAGYTLEGVASGGTERVKGTWSLAIGTWFFARNLVMMSANLTMSKERTNTGEPLYATVECELVPYKMVSYLDYLGWFKQR